MGPAAMLAVMLVLHCSFAQLPPGAQLATGQKLPPGVSPQDIQMGTGGGPPGGQPSPPSADDQA
jgi:hypothetical protein